MKIAYIATSSIPSLTANSGQVMKVCQAFALNGHEVQLYIPGSGISDWAELKHQYGLTREFPITRLSSSPFWRRFDFILDALGLAKQLPADLVYTRMIWVAVLAGWFHLPAILELHDLPAGRFGKPLFTRYLQSSSKNLTVLITAALGRVIEEKFNLRLPEKSSVVAPDGVDLERYLNLPSAEEARRQLGLKENLTAVYTGGFYPGRGLELLLDLAKAFPQVEFLWVGGKPEAVSAWKAIIQNLEIKNITLTGFIANQELPLYQAAADILLMPFGRVVSGSSGGNTAEVCSPMKMFEYMAAGRVILTSDLPVLHEVLNSSNAMFYAIEDLEDLKKKFSALVNDADLRRRMAEQAKTDVEKYTWQKRMHKILNAFLEMP